MRITSRTLDALRLLGEIWRLAGRPYKIGRGRKYSEGLAIELRHAKILDGRKGPGGGYLLARPADEISVESVIDAVETTHDLRPEQWAFASALRSLLGPDVVMLSDIIRRCGLKVIPPPAPPAPKPEPKYLNPNPPDVRGVATSVFDLGRGLR